MTTQPKLLLLDAKAILYRSHFALLRNPRFNKQGLNTSALFGFTNTLISLWQKLHPTHMVVASDAAGPTWRSDLYAPYKAHREAQPEDIEFATTYLPKLLEAFRIPMLDKQGYEADDLIGTLAHQASAQGMTVYMVTPDKDFAQLLDDHILWYKPGMGSKPDTIMERADVLAQWGIQQPSQVQDILGLWGDSSDNIPGVPGIGQKGAQKLIAQFGSIENILQHKDDLTPKHQALFQEYGSQALLCKQLATISTDVPLAFDLTQAHHQGIDHDKVKALFTELDFRTLAKRLQAPKTPLQGQLSLFPPPAKPTDPAEETDIQDTFATLATTPHTYTCLTDLAACQRLVEKLQAHNRFAVDTETTSLDPRHADLLGIAFACQPHEAYYIPMAPHGSLGVTETLDVLRPLLTHPRITKVGQNLKYDMHVLRCHGIDLQGPLFDTMVAHHLLHPDQRHGLNTMSESHLNYRPIPMEALIGPRGPQQKKITDIPLPDVTDYACEDADLTLQLYEQFAPALQQDNLAPLFHNIEMPLLPILVDMEATGVTLDTQALANASTTLQQELQTLTHTIHTHAGHPFNIDSPKQLGDVLFRELQISANPTQTKTGQYATGEAILSKLTTKHPIIPPVLSYRELQKLKSTYIEALPNLIDPDDGRLHTSYHQTIVSTGRLSSTQPNLQNIPIRTDRGRTIRQAFVPSHPDSRLLSADYAQIELRIMAHLSRDPNLLATFQAGQDVHQATAAHLFNVAPEDVTQAQRRKAKMTNFSILYGITPYGLSQRLDIPRHETKAIIDHYFQSFPNVKAYIDTTIAQARDQGWVSTLLGRKRHLPDIHSRNATLRGFAERNAINMPIQGTQAEMIKQAMINIHAWLQQASLHAKMIMQVHDELVFDVPPDELPMLQQKIPTLMAEALPLSLPIVVDVGVGKNWLAAH